MSVSTGSVAVEIVPHADGFFATCNAVGLRAFAKTEEEALRRLKAMLDARHPELVVYMVDKSRRSASAVRSERTALLTSSPLISPPAVDKSRSPKSTLASIAPNGYGAPRDADHGSPQSSTASL